MRKLLIATSFLIIFTACQTTTVTVNSREYKIDEYFFDFSQYEIPISPEPFYTSYTPIGMITIDCTSGYKSKTTTTKNNIDDIYSDKQTTDYNIKTETNITECMIEDLIPKLISKAKEQGGNAIMNFKIIENYPILTIEGFAIKMKEGNS